MKYLPPWAKKTLAIIYQLFFVLLILSGGFVIFHNLYFTPIKIVGSSMLPTLTNQEFGIMDQHNRAIDQLERFDIIIIQQQSQINRYLIKRVIGLPGDTISFNLSGDLYINEAFVDQSDFLPAINQEKTCLNPLNYGCTPMTLEPSQYFVAGDNRGYSTDSRAFGPVSRTQVIGKLIAIEGLCLANDQQEIAEDPEACSQRRYTWPRLFI